MKIKVAVVAVLISVGILPGVSWGQLQLPTESAVIPRAPDCGDCLTSSTGSTTITYGWTATAAKAPIVSNSAPANAQVVSVYVSSISGTPDLVFSQLWLAHFGASVPLVSPPGTYPTSGNPMTLPFQGQIVNQGPWALTPTILSYSASSTLQVSITINWQVPTSPPAPPPSSSNNSSIVDIKLPYNTMVAGRPYVISVSIKNTGTSTWTPGKYQLLLVGEQASTNNGNNWGGSIALGAATVAPGQVYTFMWTIYPPATLQTYNVSWQMTQVDVETFGAIASATIKVTNSRRFTGDFNGDGKSDVLDIIDGNFFVGLSNGSSFAEFSNWASVPGWESVFLPDSAARTFVADVNGDGKDDFLFAWPDGNIWVATSDGTKFNFGLWYSNPGWISVFDAASPARMYIGDFNGDGKKDLMFTWTDGNIWVATSDGTKFNFSLWNSTPGWGPVFSANSQARTFVSDFNGDGKDDFLFTWPDGNWWVATSDGTKFSFSLWYSNPGWGYVFDAASVARMFVGDFNGDGKKDLMFTWTDGNIWVATSNGTNFNFSLWNSTPGWGPVFSANSLARTFVSDFNGDGKDDFLFTWSDGNWWVATSDGTKFSFSLWFSNPPWNSVFNATSPARMYVADYNGDGKKDLMFTWPDGNWWTGTSDGSHFNMSLFSEYWP